MNDVEKLTLAALMHDIGKFAQLAGEAVPGSEIDYFKTKNLDIPIESNHFHALQSASFLKKHLQDETIEALIAFHHRPEVVPVEIQFQAKCLSIADWLAHGEYRGDEKNISMEILQQPLKSIFSKIKLNGKASPETFISPSDLSLNLENLFPKSPKELKVPLSEKQYSKIWNDFKTNFSKIDFSKDFEKVISQIYYLLEKFTITVPNFTETGETYIPLFHHLKITAAICSCLISIEPERIEKIYQSLCQNGQGNNISDEKVCYLVGGDISGIQDFIYSVTSQNALRGLRGRSFYLQLLSDAVAKSMLATHDQTLVNIIFIGGGHFFLLLPYAEDLPEKIELIKKAVDLTLFKAHRGKLAFAISTQEISVGDLIENRFNNVFQTLKQNLAIMKRKKFSSLIKDKAIQAELLGPYDIGGEQSVCQICSNELTDEEAEAAESPESAQCDFCKSFIELANDLSRTEILTEIKRDVTFKHPAGKIQSAYQVLNTLGTGFRLKETKSNKGLKYLINDSNFMDKSLDGFHLLPQYAPRNDTNGNIKMLEDFARIATGLETWGVFRADVDHLGLIFKNGLGSNASIAEISTLSYFTSLFFSAQVEYIAKESFKENVYIIYSGGDDMFALGSWSALPQFGEKIREDFKKFTGNPSINISGGIYLAPSEKFPVYQAADSAGDSLEKAKNEGRNKITFFDRTLKWEELKDLEEVNNKITDLLEPSTSDNSDTKVKKLPRSLLQILYAGWAEKERAESAKQISIFRVWRLLYAFKRLKERNNKLAVEIANLENTVLLNKRTVRPNLDVAIRWAEFLTREKKRRK